MEVAWTCQYFGPSRKETDLIVVVVCERGDTQVHLIQMLTMGMGVGSRWGGGERYTCKGGRLGRPGVHLASLSKLLGMGGGREAQRGIDLFLKCKFEE